MVKTIPWNDGNGNIVLTYTGEGNATVTVETDTDNLGEDRSQVLTFKTTGANPATVEVTVTQEACPYNFRTADEYFVRTSDGYIINVQEEE